MGGGAWGSQGSHVMGEKGDFPRMGILREVIDGRGRPGKPAGAA